MIQRFRKIYKFLVPSWLSSDELDNGTGEGGRVFASLGIIKDAFVDRVRQGLEARMPTRAGASANALTAGDRGLVRGRVETNPAFAERLVAWRLPRTHRVRGNAYEALRQVWHYFGGIDCNSIDLRGQQFSIDVGGTESADGLLAWDWDSDAIFFDEPSNGTASNTLGGGTLAPSIPGHKPGALLLAHVLAEGGTVVTPDGWEIVYSHSPSGSNLHVLFGRISDDTEGLTLSIDATATSGRAIACVTELAGEWDTPLSINFEETIVSTGSGTSVTQPDFPAAWWAGTCLAFLGYDSGGTASAFAGASPAWGEIAAEDVAGSAGGGVGIQAQVSYMYATEDGTGAATLGNTASWGLIGLRIRRSWAHFWLTITPAAAAGIDVQPDFGDAELWGGAIGTPGYTLGQTGITPADVLAVKSLFQELAWHPEHARPEWLIVTMPFDGGQGDPPAPDGTWRHWSRPVSIGADHIQTATRSADHRYWSLSPLENNTYSGYRTNFPDGSEMPGGSTYNGDRSNAAAWGSIALPSGATYTGNRASFPADVLLLDDGAATR